MKFVLAPDSFKESMSSIEASIAMETGIRKVFPKAECVKIPMADGGEGTLEALVFGSGGKIMKEKVMDPLGKEIIAEYGLSGDGKTAFIEMARASGLHLVKREERNPLLTTSYGTGQLIKAALAHRIEKMIIGIGGSATNDGGVGMLQALGVQFLDKDKKELPFGGGALNLLETIKTENVDSRLKNVEIIIACDVTNPLIGKTGASYVFGPQKGADGEMVELLDKNLTHYGNKIYQFTNKRVENIPGAGAAGGIGAAFIAFLNGKLMRGIDLVMEFTELEKKLIGANYVFTGEGSIDGQTLYGKTPYGVAKVANTYGVPVIAFAGKIGTDIHKLYERGFAAIIGILREATNIETALQTGKDNLTFAVENICRVIKSCKS